MRILILDVNYGNSSTGKLVVGLEKGLKQFGNEVLVCYGRSTGEDAAGGVKIAYEIEVITHAFLTRLTGYTGCFSPVATRKLLEILDQFRPDIVHLHELHGYYINITEVIGYLKTKRIPTVWTFHCEFMYTGKCGYSLDCDQWKTECTHCPLLHDYPGSWCFDNVSVMHKWKKQAFLDFKRLTIVTPSIWLADRVKQSFVGTKNISVIYNGIDTKEIFFPRETSNLKKRHNIKSKYIVISVAPDLMSERKGGRWVLEIAKRFENEDVTFVMIGVDNPSEIDRKNIIVMPRVSDQSELAAYYSLGNVLLLTSLKETFSLVCAESLACGTPVIGFDSGAPSEVAPEHYGCFLPYGDLNGLQIMLCKIINGEPVMESREQCAYFARSNFDKEIMIQKYNDIYKSMLNQFGPPIY